MPRVADHDARRGQVAAAVQRLISTDGLGAVTVARTAAEAGVSVGLVQHYFPSKDEMLLFTYERVLDRTDRRLAELIERAESTGTRVEHLLLDGLAESLPLDERRREEWRVALALTGRSTDDPRLAGARTATLAQVRARIAQAVTSGKECGEVERDTDAAFEATRIAAYAEGLAHHLHADPAGMPPETALSALADHLARVFPGTCLLRDRGRGERPEGLTAVRS